MQSGQRRALSITTPFSIEKLSFGRPAIPQERIFTSSPRHFSSAKCSLPAIPFSREVFPQSPTWDSRNSGVKAPR